MDPVLLGINGFYFTQCNLTSNRITLILPREYEISKTILDAAESKMDFSERGQSRIWIYQ